MALPAPSAVAPCQHLDRLPRGDDRNIGVGYAIAMAGVGAGVLYFVVQAVVTLLLSLSIGNATSGLFLGFAAVAFLPGAVTVAGVVVPLVFVAGALNGLLTTLLVYLGPAVVGVCGAAILATVTGGAVTEVVSGSALFAGYLFVSTCWVTLPVGVLAGTLYERSRPSEE